MSVVHLFNELENRVPPPLVFLATAWLMRLGGGAGVFHPGIRWLTMIVFGLPALYLAPRAILRFRRAGTTVSPIRIGDARVLVTNGVYAYTRNPMYLSLACLLVAWAAYLNTAWACLGPLLFIAYMTRFQIMPEERVLLSLFGEDYRRYQNRVRRWF